MTAEPELDIHHPSMLSAGGGLQAAMEQLGGHWTALGHALAELEPMVGDDLISQLIGGSFQGIRDTADDTLRSVLESLGGHGARVLQALANVHTTEQEVVLGVESIRLP